MSREDTLLTIVDDEDSNILTSSDIKELKRLARLSRTTRYIFTFLMGIVAAVGIPAIASLIQGITKNVH